MMRCLTNPLFLFLAVWTVAGTFYISGICWGVFPAFEPIAALAVLLSLLAFALGYFTWLLFRRLSPSAQETLDLPLKTLRPDTAARVLKLTLFMGVVALSLGLYRVAVVAAHSNSSFFELITNPGLLRLRLVMYIGASLSRINSVAILISLSSSIFAIGFIMLGVFLYIDRTALKYVYLAGFLFIGLAIGLTNLSRYEVTVNVLCLILAYGVMYSSDSSKTPRHAVFDILLPLSTVVALFIVIDLLLGKSGEYAHASRLHGFFFSLYWYVASPLAAFNEYAASFSGPYGLGQNMFFPFYKWLHRFALVPEPHVFLYSEKTFVPFMTNVYTYLRNVYQDFGMVGVAIVPYALGWATCAIQPKACRSFAFLNLYMVLLVLILFSFYNYSLMSNQVYLQVLFGFLFFRYELPSARVT